MTDEARLDRFSGGKKRPGVARSLARIGARHAAITGASSGLGAAVAEMLSGANCRLSLIGRDAARLEATASSCRNRGANVATAVCDVRDADAMSRTMLAFDGAQPIDLVIANAGIGGAGVLAPPDGEPAALAREVFETNSLGVVHTISPLIARMRERKRGRIVIVSSMLAYQGMADAPVYSASKAAARIYGQGLRRLLAEDGIKVTVACPAFIATPMSASLPQARPFEISAEAAAETILAAVAAGRAELAFPWQWSALLAIASALPGWIVEPVLTASRRALRNRD